MEEIYNVLYNNERQQRLIIYNKNNCFIIWNSRQDCVYTIVSSTNKSMFKRFTTRDKSEEYYENIKISNLESILKIDLELLRSIILKKINKL